MELLVTVLAISTLGVLAYQRVSGQAWLLGVSAILIIISASGVIGTVPLFLAWAIAIIVCGLLGVSELRLRYVSRPLLQKFRSVLPPMSDTEREALEAGSVWWDGELFSGQPDWNKLMAEPVPTLTQEERDFIDGPVDELCSMLDDWKITNVHHDLPPEVWEFIGKHRFLRHDHPQRVWRT